MVHRATLNKLRKAGELRTQADQLTVEARAILQREIPRAREAGMPVAEIAELAHLSRRAVYDFLAE